MFEWLKNAWNGLFDWLDEIWTSIVEFFTELPIIALEGSLGGVADVFDLIPVPDFLSAGLQSLLSSVHPSVSYFLMVSGFSEALLIIGSAFVFRHSRKLSTLGKW